MTDKAPATQASIKRAILAARKAGMRVTGIRSDGTVLVDDGTSERPTFDNIRIPASEWEDIGHG